MLFGSGGSVVGSHVDCGVGSGMVGGSGVVVPGVPMSFPGWFRVIQEIVVQVPIVVPMVVSEVLPVWVQLWSSQAAVRVSYHPGPGLIFIHFSSHGCLIYRCRIAHCPSQGKLSQIVPSS